MATYFVSDFHFGEADSRQESRKYDRFCSFLAQRQSDIEHLVILGDLFDFWFEYHHLLPKHHLPILFGLRDLVRGGVRVSYVCGNHDFWMGDFMEMELGIKLIRDRLVIETPEGKILALHGDGIAPSDWKYRILKSILRNRVNIALYRLLPPGLAYSLALGVSRRSRGHTAQRPKESFVEEYIDYARARIAEGYHALICGHIHLPEIRKIDDGFYVNSGDWLSHFSYVRYDRGDFEIGYAPESG
jgi:UDP-2,3-diacylglucosamine hydrolase